MIIKKVKIYPLSYNLKVPFASAGGWTKKRTSVLIEVITNEGLSGWGEANGPMLAIMKAIEDDLVPIVIGKDPLNTSIIWEQMNLLRRKGIPSSAVGGVDIALWDLKGKIIGEPLYKIFGGAFFEKLLPYATTIFYHENDLNSLKGLEEDISYLIDHGFKAVKMKVGFGIDFDLKRIRRVRELLGTDFPIMVDANQSYNFLTSLRFGHILEEFGIRWLEEPIPWISLSAYKKLGEKLDIPIAGGESEVNIMGFVEAFKQGSVSIIQPDICMIGGITPALSIATLARAFGVDFCPHSFGTIIGWSASVHLASGFPHYIGENLSIQSPVLLEWDVTENIMRDNIVVKKPEIINGVMHVTNDHGLGVEVDREEIEKFIIK